MVDFLLVDGHNLAFRSFYGVGELSRSDGFPVGALYGYISTIWRLQKNVNSAHTVIFFDHGRCVKRLGLLPEYKGHRKSMPDELRLQLKHIRSVTPLLGAVKIEREGIEADDLLASFAVREAARNKTVVIASSDKDFAQLVSERISLYVPPSPRSESGKWSKMDISAVDRKFGVHPRCIVDYLSLVGDSADNISGVRGFGIKTAAKWLKCYGSIDGIRDHLGALPKRLAQNFRDSEKTMELNRSIVRFDTSIDVQEISEVSIDVDLLLKFLMEFELYDLADRLQSRRVGQQQLACMQ